MHEGHRQRMYEKLENGEFLFAHEVLEILLYTVIPRDDTNPIAHALIDRFGSFDNVFKASVRELKCVNGVGENVARYIRAIGRCTEYRELDRSIVRLGTLGECKEFILTRLKGRAEECLEIYFLGKGFKLKRIFSYNDGDKTRVTFSLEEVIKNLAYYRPDSVVIAHNHIGSDSHPSPQDDYYTRAIQLLCGIHNVKFYDHLIYSDKEGFFSYRDSDRLLLTAKSCNLENFEKWIKTLS